LSATITGTVSTLAFQFEKEALGKLGGVRGFAPYRRQVAGALAVLGIEIGGGGKRTARITPGSLPASVPRFCERSHGKLALGVARRKRSPASAE
jgi:hypothetical protein